MAVVSDFKRVNNFSDSETSVVKVRRQGFVSALMHLLKWIIICIVLFFAFTGFMFYGVPYLEDRKVIFSDTTASVNIENAEAQKKILAEKASLQKSIQGLEKQYLSQTPKSTYIVINTSNNEFRLFQADKLIRQGKCSTGSYTVLQKSQEEQWIFKTPKGVRRIRGKTTSPVWVKPDWAFIEEGLPVPPPGHPSRYESGSLGDYALSMGDGYLIHGTLYKRLLGMPVTHGCVRMNDDDLEVVYKTLEIGSKVYIY